MSYYVFLKRFAMVEDAETLLFKLFKYYDVYSNNELSLKINTPAGTISKWKQRNSIGAIKKKCRELGIYEDIFEVTNTSFMQTGANSQQIKTQDNTNSSNINNFNSSSRPDIDSDLLKLTEALSSVANALNKKEELKQELTKLITKLPSL